MCKSLPCGTCFDSMEVAGLKGLWREAEAWHHVTGLEFIKRDQQRQLIMVQPQLQWRPQNIGDVRTVGDCQGQWQVWSEASLSL